LVNRGIKETGTSENVPRTAAINRTADGEKNSAIELEALLRHIPPGYQARSLNVQRRLESIPPKIWPTRWLLAQKHCKRTPLTQLSEFAYNFTESHPDILAPTQSYKEAKPYQIRDAWALLEQAGITP
jgi:hypothetical protein